MTPQEFVAKWKQANLSERAACQEHFIDLCNVLGQPTPAKADPDGAFYTFERGVNKTGGGKGWADVWFRGHFGWEYKGKHKDLAAAYAQLLLYREALENPPLLVVCDLDRFEIHTNFTGTAKRVYAFDLDHVAEPGNLDTLRKLFTDPDALRPGQTTESVTRQAAERFGLLADGMRVRGIPAQGAAHFLMKLMFCMFAEDIGLLPATPEKLFKKTLLNARDDAARLTDHLRSLFQAMATGDWILDGAIVHVSMIGFDKNVERQRQLDGMAVATINANLTSAADATAARKLGDSLNICFMGPSKKASFDISDQQPIAFLLAPNPDGRPNSDVVRPWSNALDLMRRPRSMWIIDFGNNMAGEQAAG